MKLGAWTIGEQIPTAVPEYAAEGEVERVYHEIRQSLRVTGVNLVFRTWAGLGPFLPALWEELRPNVETTLLDETADTVRQEALRLAGELAQPIAPDVAALGQSRAFQIRSALELYQDINPKLLVLVCAVRQALQGEAVAVAAEPQPEPAPRGEPARMYPMEMESQKPDNKTIRRLYKDIEKTLSLPSINSDYRTLALWPDYLASAWQRLKPLCQTREFASAADRLREQAQSLARRLPYPIALSLGRVKELGQDPDQVFETTKRFEQLLPGLILNIALLRQDWSQTQAVASAREPSSRAPTVTESMPPWRVFQQRQQVVELDGQFMSYLDEGQGEPVVLLHGIPTWSFLWEQTIALLSPRYRLLVPDLLGYGYSSKRDNFDRSIARQAEALDAFLTQVNLPAVHLVGHDIGGGTALRLATLFPQRVRSLTLMNSVCYDSWPVEMMLQLGNPSSARKMAPNRTVQLLGKALQGMFHQPPDDQWLAGLLSPWRTEVGRLSLVRNAAALNTNHTMEITRLLPDIRVPTLILWGEDDPHQPVKYAQWLARDIPGARLVRMAAARHFVMRDQPERVHQALQQFLDSLATQENRAAA